MSIDFNRIKKSRRPSIDIDEKIEYLNKELKKNNLHELMTTSGMYFASQDNPAIPAINANVPDSTGVLGSGFTPPIGGNGNANDPSNYPAAFDTAWMYNSNDVDGVTNRPIVKTMDQSVIDAYNTANPENSRFPAGGAGVVFGPRGFGTGVGYVSNGHYIGVLNPGLFGDGSTKLVPPGSPFGAPWFGMGGMYFPATPELAGVIMSMTGTYQSLGGYNPSGARPIQLWAPWSRFHDGDWEDQGTQKYINNTGNRYVIRTFYLYAIANDYVQTPAVPPTTTVLYRNDLGDSGFLPINIDLGDLSKQGFDYLKGKAVASSGVNYDVYDRLWKDHGIEAANWYENNPDLPGSSNPHVNPLIPLPLELVQNDSKSEPVSDIETSGLGAKPGDQLASASDTNDDAAKSAYFKAGGQMPWNYLDPIQKDYWRNKVGKGSDSLESQPQAPVDPPVYIDASKITSDDIPDEFEDDEKPSAKGVKLTKWMSRTDFMKKYPDSSMTEYLDALPYGATDFMKPNSKYKGAWDVNTKGFEDYFMKGDLSALGNSRGTPEPRHSEATPDPEPTKKSSIFTDAITKLGNFATDPLQAVADFFGNYLTPPAAEYSTNIAKSVAINKPITVKQEDIPKGDIKKFFKNFGPAQPLPIVSGKPVPYADDNFYADEKGNIKSNIGPNGEKGFYKKNNTGDMGGGKGIAGFGNPLAAAGQAQTQFVEPDDGSEPYFLYTDHAYHNLTSDDKGEVPDPIKKALSGALHALTGKSDATKPNTGAMSGYPPNIKGDVKTEFKIPYSKLPKNIKNRVDNERKYQELVKAGKLKNIDDPYQPESFNVSKNKPAGKLLSEAAKLGYFEPEALTVDIEDLRKGIIPEFPKDPPPKLIDGYSEKSRLAPKEIERKSFIKITKKDLAKNHMLKDSEIKHFMNQINAVNEFIKKHPEELIYAQQRYPKHDPRLAQLNWQMDQMLNAGKDYVDKQFPENQKLFDKIKKKIKNTIDQTDPKKFKDTKLPKFDKTHLEDFKRKKEVYSRFMKKPVKTKKLFQKTKKRG